MSSERIAIQVLQTNTWIDFESCDIADVPYRMSNLEQYHLGRNGWQAIRAIDQSGNIVQYLIASHSC
ncbi:hypothetical protein N9V24_04995 [Pseudomonadota bacterium]|nr:hypothetical protein [Pseudomonadota bacterium]